VGIENFVVTGSSGAFLGRNEEKIFTGVTITADDWTEVTYEETTDGTRDPMFVYGAAKTLAERAAWKFAEEHPEINLTTVAPPRLYGPFAKGQPLEKTSDLSTNIILYAVLTGKVPRSQLRPLFCDVRDVALAHVRALDHAKEDKSVKRFIVSGGYFTLSDACRYLATTRPALKSRLPPSLCEEDVELPGPVCQIAVGPASSKLGLEFRDWKETVDDAVDDLISLEDPNGTCKLEETNWGNMFLN